MEPFKRSAADLMKKLQEVAAAKHVQHTMLLIAYEDHVAKVPLGDPKETRKALDAHVEAGGLPVGVIAFQVEGIRARVSPLLLPEHIGVEPLEKLLLSAQAEIKRGLLATGEVQLDQSKSGW